MRKSLKVLFLGMIISLVFSLCSCTGEADISVNKDGSVYFEFNGDIGGTFKDMMESMGEDNGIDEDSIKTELLHSGFSNVKVKTNNDVINISFVDKGRKSPLFSLGIISLKNDKLSISITPEKFLKLYDVSGEELQGVLDLFLSPVLNEEVMSKEEYVDTINVAYGQAAGNEINKSVVKFNVTDKNGSKKKRTVYVKDILCGGKVIF